MEDLLIVIFVPCLIAGIVCFIFWSQMKSAVIQSAAKEYIMESGVEINNREDVFSHSTETRRKIQTSQDKKS